MFQEEDERFRVRVSRSSSGELVFVTAASRGVTKNFYLVADDPSNRLIGIDGIAVNPPWHTHHSHTYRAAELLEGIGPAVAGWAVEVCEERWQRATGPDGRSGHRADAIVCLRRAQATEEGSGT